jgi:hypothetical protein
LFHALALQEISKPQATGRQKSFGEAVIGHGTRISSAGTKRQLADDVGRAEWINAQKSPEEFDVVEPSAVNLHREVVKVWLV